MITSPDFWALVRESILLWMKPPDCVHTISPREQKQTAQFQREMDTMRTTARRVQSARRHRDRNPLI